MKVAHSAGFGLLRAMFEAVEVSDEAGVAEIANVLVIPPLGYRLLRGLFIAAQI